jgi:hypothetical protein
MKKKINRYNKLCEKCLNNCKQSPDKILLGCPNYQFKPQQLEIKFKFPKKEK